MLHLWEAHADPLRRAFPFSIDRNASSALRFAAPRNASQRPPVQRSGSKALPTVGPKLRLRFMARPSSYSPVILPVVRACATFGATAEEIANYLNIPWGSFKRWIYA